MRLLTPSLFLACSPKGPEAPTVDVELVVSSDLKSVISSFVAHTPGRFEVVEEPTDSATVTVHLNESLTCSECYEIEGSDNEFEILAGDALGIQYGLAALLEAWGYRFHHPFDTVVPSEIPNLAADHPVLNERMEPQMALRSLHLHTLHPIEGLQAFWIGGDGQAERAEQVIDWVVKNRGNDLQWVSLDDVMGTARARDWLAHTQEVVTYAHARGLTVGLGIQLFGSGNLQQAFDLLDRVGSPAANQAEIESRLSILTEAGFDRFNLSFGEFFGEDPETFVAMVNQVWTVLQELDSDAELTTLIHVGDSEEQRVVYGEEEMIYYFLAQFADPDIVPWVHTVMLYNLFEDAGGAYHHERFDAHRELLLQRIESGQPTAYFPESSYWVAFDNSVPVYLPAYMRSRWLDMDRIRAEAGPLPGHVLFSTGWEWGYWQTDVATLRMNYSLDGGAGVGPGWSGLVTWMYEPWGDAGAKVADAVIQLAESQARALIHDRLMAYFAGRDSTIDIGEAVGVVAQPPRVRLDRIHTLSVEELRSFEVEVLEPLATHVADIERIEGLLPDTASSQWLQEVHDGIAVTKLRGAFVLAAYRTAVAYLRSEPVDSDLVVLDGIFDEAARVVGRRHENMHDPGGEQWVSPTWSNPTIYQYGYLLRSDELCFWQRERAKLANLVAGETVETVPGCAL